MPAAAPPPPAPTKTATVASIAPPPSKPVDQPTKIDAPSGNEPSVEQYLADDMAEFEQMEKEPERPRTPEGKFKKPEKAPERPQDEPKDEKAPETPPEPEKPVEEPIPGTMAALRKAYNDVKAQRDKELRPKVQSLESENAQLKRTLEEARKSSPDVKPYEEKLSALQKQNQELLEAVRYSDFTKSPEFKEKYVAPYEEAWSEAMSELGEIVVTTQDGGTRKFNANDLLSLANASVDKSDEIIEASFPRVTTQQRVISHVNEIRKLAKAQEKALKDAQKGAGEFYQKKTQAQQQADQAFAQHYKGANDEITKRYPKVFGEDPTDPKGNALLKQGLEYVDSVLSPNGTQLTPQQKAGRLAVMRYKSANHDRILQREKGKDARIAELEAKLAEFEQSEPPTDEAGSPGQGGAPMDWEARDLDELRKLER